MKGRPFLFFLLEFYSKCKVIEGLSYQEIAEALNNTVRTRLKRAREELIAVRK
ncbi:MAG: hypothetical protein GY941_29450 [Planctomycetes bacterium]|nr:hypothetical protein [Planctomycetota bacterium]